MSTFFPIAFTFDSLVLTGARTVLARFSFQPNAGTGGYVFSTPGGETRTVESAIHGANYGEVVVTVTEDFSSGTWTLTCNSGVTAGSPPVPVTEASKTFTVIAGPPPYLPLTGVNDNAAAFLRKQIPKSMKGPAWDAMLTALATGSEQPAWDNALNIYDSLFLVSAYDYYLNRQAANLGLERPHDVPMTDDAWRRLVIAVSADKLTVSAIMDVLTIFYGVDATHAHVTSDLATFGLSDGATLDISFDGATPVTVTFQDSDFADITQATATEVAAALSRSFIRQGVSHFARVVTDSAGEEMVSIYSGTSGLQGSVLVSPGAVQATLALPTTRASLLGQMRASYVHTRGPSAVEVIFPATTDVVERTINTGAYTSEFSSDLGTGPYLSEGIDKGLAVTETSSTTAMAVVAGHQYRLLQVANSSVFPDGAGWLVIGYGWKYQTDLVPYLARAGAGALTLDPTFTFTKDIPSGADVRLLVGKSPPSPSKGQFWATASPAGRVAAMKFVDFIVAAGYSLKKTTVYPSDVGLGNEGAPKSGAPKLSDVVQVFGGNDIESEVAALRKEP